MISLLISSQFFELSDGVIAMGASMQHIFPIIYAARNVKAANAAKTAESSSNQHLKSTNAFLGSSPDFFIAVRTIRPHWIGSCHFSHFDLQSLSNKIFRLLDLEVKWRFRNRTV